MNHPLSANISECRSRAEAKGFTLVELLVVVAIMALIIAASTPALRGLKGSGDFTKASGSLLDAINLARTYAVANNTYVYLGIAEIQRNQPASTASATAGIGEIVVAIVASKDGTSSRTAGTWADNYSNGADLALVTKLQFFDQVHVATSPFPQGTGTMARPTDNVANFGSNTLVDFTQTPFSLPLGRSIGGGQYNFVNVIPFNPQGAPMPNGQAVEWIEIDFQPSPGSGSTAPTPPTNVNAGNQAAILIDGSTGVPRLYRP